MGLCEQVISMEGVSMSTRSCSVHWLTRDLCLLALQTVLGEAFVTVLRSGPEREKHLADLEVLGGM